MIFKVRHYVSRYNKRRHPYNCPSKFLMATNFRHSDKNDRHPRELFHLIFIFGDIISWCGARSYCIRNTTTIFFFFWQFDSLLNARSRYFTYKASAGIALMSTRKFACPYFLTVFFAFLTTLTLKMQKI